MPFIGVQPVASATTATSLSGVTSTTAELNILDGVTATAAELNILDGVTATAAELNYLDITTLGSSEASKVLTANSSGKVGIGTSSPQEQLHVYTTSDARIEIEGTTSIAAFKATNNQGSYAWYVDSSADKFHLYDFTDTANRLTLDGDGKVGIGTTSPNFSLEVQGSSNQVISIQTTGTTDNTQIRFGDADNSDQGKVNYDHSVDAMTFHTSDAERMRIASSGVVGIGTSSPVGILHLQSDDNGVVFQSSSSTNSRAQIFFQNNGGTQRAKIAVDPDGGNANVMAFSTGTTERMRIDSSGNVGIGTSSPATTAKLSISDSSIAAISIDNPSGRAYELTSTSTGNFGLLDRDAVSYRLLVNSSGNVGIGTASPSKILELSGTNSGSTSDNPTATLRLTDSDTSTAAEQPIGKIEFYGNDGTVPSQNVMAYVLSKAASTSGGGDLRFGVCTSGSASEAMRIDSSGNLLVGKTNTGHVNDGAHLGTSGCFLTAASTAPLTLRRSAAGVVIQLSRGGVNEGTLTMNTGSAPTLASGSDIRLKENVTEHCPELQNILSIKTRQWNWKDKEKGSGEGVVAQELEGIYPDLVFEDNDGMLNVKDFGPMTTRLVKAIQELSAQVNELKAEVAALKGA